MDPFLRFDSMRSFDCYTLLQIGFTAFASHRVDSVNDRRSALRARINDAQLVVDAIVTGVKGLPLMARCEVLAGPEMRSATAALCAAVQAFSAPPQVRPVVVRTPVRPGRAADSELAYRVLTQCVIPLHRGHLESYKMDRGVRLAKAFLIIDEHDLLITRLSLWAGDELVHTTSLVRNLHDSILLRLRRLSMDFIPLGALGDSAAVPSLLLALLVRCRKDTHCRIALADPKGPASLARLS
jgi:hypothetical protein